MLGDHFAERGRRTGRAQRAPRGWAEEQLSPGRQALSWGNPSVVDPEEPRRPAQQTGFFTAGEAAALRGAEAGRGLKLTLPAPVQLSRHHRAAASAQRPKGSGDGDGETVPVSMYLLTSL